MRRILREIWLPVLLSVSVAIATAVDLPHYGPHAEGSLWFPILLMQFLMPALGIRAAVQRKWLRAGFYVLALITCIVCSKILSDAGYCPVCRT